MQVLSLVHGSHQEGERVPIARRGLIQSDKECLVWGVGQSRGDTLQQDSKGQVKSISANDMGSKWTHASSHQALPSLPFSVLSALHGDERMDTR